MLTHDTHHGAVHGAMRQGWFNRNLNLIAFSTFADESSSHLAQGSFRGLHGCASSL